MATLILSSNPAKDNGRGMVMVTFSLCGAPDPLPRELVEVRTAKDAQALFDAYHAKAAKAGHGMQITGRLKDGERAPRGFHQLKLRAFVNV